MNFTKSLAIAAIVMGLGATSLAKVHDDHKGYEKGKKTGWHDGTLPPGQAKKVAGTQSAKPFAPGQQKH